MREVLVYPPPMASALLDRCSSIQNDGNLCNNPPEEGRDQYLNYLLGQTEQEDKRLSTFRRFPPSSTALPRRLAQAGFYYLGHGDVVKCFSCGQCVENMTRNDNPRDPRYHRHDCLHINGVDPANIPSTTGASSLFGAFLSTLPASANNNIDNENTGARRRQSSESRSQSSMEERRRSPLPRPTPQTSNENRGSQEGPSSRRAPSPAPRSSNAEEERHLFPCRHPQSPNMRDINRRRDSFFNRGTQWQRNRVIASPRDIAEAGFYYLGERDRVKCWYCDGGLENWEVDDDPWIEHAKWFPTCEFLLQQKGREFVEMISSQFPTLQRPNPTAPTPTGPTQQNPTFGASGIGGAPRGRHGISIGHTPNPIRINLPGLNINVRSISSGNVIHTGGSGSNGIRIIRSGRNRNPPQIVDRQEASARHERTVNEAMTSSPFVASAREIGYSDDVIRMVLLSKCEESNSLFDTLDQMIDAIIEYQAELERTDLANQPQTSAATSSTSPSSREAAQSLTPAEQQLRRLEESRNCRLCHREVASVVLMPCAHLAVCTNCSSRNIRICPVCKRLVREKIRSFLS